MAAEDAIEAEQEQAELLEQEEAEMLEQEEAEMLEQEEAEMLEQEEAEQAKQAAAEETPSDANGFATTAPYYHANGEQYNEDGFESNGDNENGTRYKDGFALDGSEAPETPRDANGFATTAPYYHSNGEQYNEDGFDRNGDNENGTRYKDGFALDGSEEPETPRDANGFATTAPYYHSNGEQYNEDGFDRNGDNENGTRYKDGFALDGSEEPETPRDANGFATTAPYYHSNGEQYNAEGRDYQGYNEAGYNSEGYSSSRLHQFIMQTYDVSPA